MLKKRIIACLIIKNKNVVQSIGFKKYLPVGNPVIAVEFLNMWGIDEIVIIDIDASLQHRDPDFDMITEISNKNFVPLTIGGGIRGLDDMRRLIHCGADKISINKAALLNPDIVKHASEIFGNQCIVVSMDVALNKNREYEVFSDSGKTPTGLNPVAWAQQIEKLGAGEILLSSIDCDGSKKGYDLKLVKAVSASVNIPVIACGGAGQPKHFLDGIIKGKASAVSAGNYFHFIEHSPIIVKAFLAKNSIDVRLDTHANYKHADFNDMGRPGKNCDAYLDKLRFEYIPEEII